MAFDFKSFKKNSDNSLGSLAKKLEDLKSGTNFKDDRFWNMTKDKQGNAIATIRFLPGHPEENQEFVRYYNHGFQEKGRWFIENCPTTNGGKCPVCEANHELWESGDEINKKIVSIRKRKMSFVSNILVINDPGNPANNGKVFLFRYGKSIFDMIQRKACPEFADEEKVDVFNLWNGANFKLRQRKKDGYPYFGDSIFEAPAPVGTDKYIEEIWGQQYKLGEFVDPKNFKSYDELSKKLNDVLAGRGASKGTVEEESSSLKPPTRHARTPPSRPASAPASKAPPEEPEEESAFSKAAAEDGEDPLAYYDKLANEGDD